MKNVHFVRTFLQIFEDGWVSGIGVAVCCYLQLIIVCDFGQKVANAVSASDLDTV